MKSPTAEAQHDALVSIGVLSVIVVIAGAVLVIKCEIDSRNFNRSTGAQTTWRDAVWRELKAK